MVHQTLCFFLSFQTTLVQSVFCVHPHILLHSTSIPQHTATTTMPTVSPTTTQSLRSDTAIALFVCTPSTIPFCLLSLHPLMLVVHTLALQNTLCLHTCFPQPHCVVFVCLWFWQEREKRQAMTTKKLGKEGLRVDGCWFCESPALTFSFPSTLFLCSCQHHHTPHSPFQPCALCLIPITTNERER